MEKHNCEENKFCSNEEGKTMQERIIVPTARQGQSLGESGNVDRFLMPRDSLNDEGQLSNRAEHLSARAKLDSPSEWRQRKGKLSQGRGNGLSVRLNIKIAQSTY